MRVIAGKAKGRRLYAPKGRVVRPTADRVKEAIFDILGDSVTGAEALDLYAGSGAIGIEALSRGAFRAVFVENSKVALATIRRNLEATGLADGATVLSLSTEVALDVLAREGAEFDLIFMDPPYRISADRMRRLCRRLVDELLRPSAVVVWEHSTNAKPAGMEGLIWLSRRIYGDTAVSLYRHEV